MFGSFLRLPSASSFALVALMAAAAFGLFILTEFVYIHVVKRTACREIMELKLSR